MLPHFCSCAIPMEGEMYLKDGNVDYNRDRPSWTETIFKST